MSELRWWMYRYLRPGRWAAPCTLAEAVAISGAVAVREGHDTVFFSQWGPFKWNFETTRAAVPWRVIQRQVESKRTPPNPR